jgi:hypothetical protein
MGKRQDDTYSAEETAKRRDEVIHRMVNTPPQHRPLIQSRQKKEKTTGSDRGVQNTARDRKKS